MFNENDSSILILTCIIIQNSFMYLRLRHVLIFFKLSPKKTESFSCMDPHQKTNLSSKKILMVLLVYAMKKPTHIDCQLELAGIGERMTSLTI